MLRSIVLAAALLLGSLTHADAAYDALQLELQSRANHVAMVSQLTTQINYVMTQMVAALKLKVVRSGEGELQQYDLSYFDKYYLFKAASGEICEGKVDASASHANMGYLVCHNGNMSDRSVNWDNGVITLN